MDEKEFKEKIKEIEIPKELDKVVLKSVKESMKKKKRPSYKRLLIACSLAFIILSGLGIKTYMGLIEEEPVSGLTLPTVDNKIKLMSLIDDSYLEKTEKENYDGIQGTNNQLEGVDEIDLVKTDGKYIFSTVPDMAGNNLIKIFNGENPKDVKFIGELKTDNYITGLFVYENKLVVLGYNHEGNTIITIYDYKDIKNIKKGKEVTLKGSTQTARLIGDEIVLIQEAYIYSKLEVGNALPFIIEDGVKKSEALENIKYCPGVPSNSIISIVKINLKDERVIDGESVLVNMNNVSVSSDHIFLVNYDHEKDTSEIFKFSIKENGKLVAKGTVEGRSLNQFSLDEYNGNVRIATTTNWSKENSENHLLVLNSELNEVGRVSSLGKGEVIHSVRFTGDYGYVVTFKNTDPLYTIDLRNPKEPKVIGEIKVPGVSKYLHPYDEKTLIGFGEDRDLNNFDGLKLSLFSLDNGGSELFNEKLKGGYSSGIYNHKAIFFNKENSLFGFDYGDFSSGKEDRYMVVYRISKDKGFEKVISERINPMFDGRIYGSSDTVYLILGDRVVTYDSKTFEKLDESK